MILSELRELLEFHLITIGEKSITPFDIVWVAGIFIGARLLVMAMSSFLKRSLSSRGWVDKSKQYTMIKLIKYLVYTLAIITSIDSLGFDLNVLLASSAALFVGIGLGLQAVFNDMICGLILLFEGVVKKGDLVEMSGTVGRVEQLDIRTSKIRTRDGIMLIVPNSKLVTSEVINWSHSDRNTRFKITVGVAYGSDTKLVKEILMKCATNHPDVYSEIDPLVRFEDFGDSALVFELFFWANKTWEIEMVKSDLRFQIDQSFRDAGVSIPFPQRDVHLKNN